MLYENAAKEPDPLSNSSPNRVEPVCTINLEPSQGESEHFVTNPARSALTPKPSAVLRRKTAKVSRQLTQHKIGLAWERVRRVVRDHCRQRGLRCLLCCLYGNQIEFQLATEYQPISLKLQGDRIVARIVDKKLEVRIVRIRSGGSGFELRRKIRTATWLLMELLQEARQ